MSDRIDADRLNEIREQLAAAVVDPSSAGIFYAAQESWDAHTALLNAAQAALDAAEQRATEWKRIADGLLMASEQAVARVEQAERRAVQAEQQRDEALTRMKALRYACVDARAVLADLAAKDKL